MRCVDNVSRLKINLLRCKLTMNKELIFSNNTLQVFNTLTPMSFYWLKHFWNPTFNIMWDSTVVSSPKKTRQSHMEEQGLMSTEGVTRHKHLPRAWCDTRSILKWSAVGLNLEFSFLTGCINKANEPSLTINSLLGEQQKDSCLSQLHSLVQDLNSHHRFHSL